MVPQVFLGLAFALALLLAALDHLAECCTWANRAANTGHCRHCCGRSGGWRIGDSIVHNPRAAPAPHAAANSGHALSSSLRGK